VDIPEFIKNFLEILPVKWIDKVLELALQRKREPLAEAAEDAAVATGEAAAATNLITH